MSRYRIPGLAFAVVRDGRVSAQRAYGVNDLELSTPATIDTVFQIASVSKTFAGIAVMLLAQDGKLTPESSVTELMPSLPAIWRDVRVHHLLEHTSGMPAAVESHARFAEEMRRRRNRERFVDDAKLDYFTAAERVGYLAELPLASAPGEKYSYNQPAYMLVGMLVEHLSGTPYPSFLQERVFAPLGMTSAIFGDSRVVVPGRRQVAYTRQYGPLQNWLWPYSTTDYPAAGLNTSVHDLAKLFVALQTARLLTHASMERMWTAARLADGSSIPHALGWTMTRIGAVRAVGHEGGGCAWVTHLPDEKLSVVALCNLAGSGADAMSDDLATELSRTTPPS